MRNLKSEPMMISANTEIDPKDWQSFVAKLMESVPGSSANAKHIWLKEKTGISTSTWQNWAAKSTDTPSVFNLSKIAQLTRVDLAQLVVMIQNQIDPPGVLDEAIAPRTIMALAALSQDDLETIAKNLGEIPQADIVMAASNLLRIAHAPQQ
jgi:hypothetical protein